jgi:glycosyltransferase involved in cell wall biosynthesis
VYEESQSPKVRILCVSVIEQRKNHATLLESFDRICRAGSEDIELVLVGKCFVPELEEMLVSFMQRNSRISWLRNIDDAALAEEYARCHFTVYPSIEEGFGLPIAESLWYGKPCICRDAGAMAEVADGGGCLTVDTTDPHALSKAILFLADDKESRARLVEAAVSRHLKTWSEYAYEILGNLASNGAG